MATELNRRDWNTYAIRGTPSIHGANFHQVRRTKEGFWQTRILQINGRHKTAGPIQPIGAAEGTTLFAAAQEQP